MVFHRRNRQVKELDLCAAIGQAARHSQDPQVSCPGLLTEHVTFIMPLAAARLLWKFLQGVIDLTHLHSCVVGSVHERIVTDVQHPGVLMHEREPTFNLPVRGSSTVVQCASELGTSG